jgi:ribulose-phosphate 3-epimerase
MKKELMIAPSVLSADFSNLEKSLDSVKTSDLLHLDIMDGRFVPNITFGPLVVKAIDGISDKPLDVHLMIVEPEKYIKNFIEAGADWISIHVEEVVHLQRALVQIRNLGAKAGVALNPSTQPETLEYVLEYLDFVLIMSVNPGYGGQDFIANSLKKIEKLDRMIEKSNPDVLIEVDGGITADNIAGVYKAGARVIVSGSGIFKTASPSRTIENMRGTCKGL